MIDTTPSRVCDAGPSARLPAELRQAALHLLCLADPGAKADGVRALQQRVSAGTVRVERSALLDEPAALPGRPARPTLVPPSQLVRRSMATVDGRAALLHALAHIEFNAINLALDALWRFPGMPPAYYEDWLGVAAEEALHFTLLTAHLGTHGFAYGAFPAHDGLWDMAQRTRGDALARMALVPRTLEARGLDASPGIRARLAQAGDAAGAAILDVILRDEIGHVAIGNRWYRWLCARAGADPHARYGELARQYHAPRLRGPFNLAARRAAGFDERELAALDAPSIPAHGALSDG